MITGFNTDIEYQGVTYHVQTEDKGLDSPLILSLVYNRGTILASKRSPYDDLINQGFDEKVLAERLQKQHKLICAAIRAGRIEDLKRMTGKESDSKQKNLIAADEVKTAEKIKKTEIRDFKTFSETISQENSSPSIEKKPSSLPIEENKRLLTPDIPASSERKNEEDVNSNSFNRQHGGVSANLPEEPIIEEVQIIEEEVILPAEAVIEIIADSVETQNPIDNRLKIELLTDVNFMGGERKTVNIRVKRGEAENGLSGVHILAKIVGSSFRPSIFHSKTDSNGVAAIHLQLPHFRAGRAALLIKAMSDGEEAELRRIITHG